MNKSVVGASIAVFIVIFAVIFFAFGFSDRFSSNTKPVPGTQTASTTELEIEDITEGTGPEVKSGDTISIHYNGWLADPSAGSGQAGTKFDSSYDRGEPFETQIGVGQVIKGWDEGVIGMKVGGKRKLTIPPSLGYGSEDMGQIPPNSTLIFEVELVEIK